jgi:DnaJ-class molecular chaperone
MKNLYDILGVPSIATDGEIKSAYRKLAVRFHPDKTGGDEKKSARFREVCGAYAILGSAERRIQYDKEQSASPQNVSIFGPLFDEFVNKVKADGVDLGNIDSLLRDLGDVVSDVKTNLPKRVSQSAQKSSNGILGFVEQFFDATIKEETEREQAACARRMKRKP